MKKLSFLIVTLALVWAPMAFAAGTSGPRLCKLTTLLDAIVLTDTLANRTATIGPEDTCGTGVIGRSSRKVTVGSFQYANFDINYTRATAGDLTLTFTTGITAATATAALGVLDGGQRQLPTRRGRARDHHGHDKQHPCRPAARHPKSPGYQGGGRALGCRGRRHHNAQRLPDRLRRPR